MLQKNSVTHKHGSLIELGALALAARTANEIVHAAFTQQVIQQ